MRLADLPEGKRFTVWPSGPIGRLIRTGPTYAMVRIEKAPEVGGAYVTHLQAGTEVEPLPE